MPRTKLVRRKMAVVAVVLATLSTIAAAPSTASQPADEDAINAEAAVTIQDVSDQEVVRSRAVVGLTADPVEIRELRAGSASPAAFEQYGLLMTEDELERFEDQMERRNQAQTMFEQAPTILGEVYAYTWFDYGADAVAVTTTRDPGQQLKRAISDLLVGENFDWRVVENSAAELERSFETLLPRMDEAGILGLGTEPTRNIVVVETVDPPTTTKVIDALGIEPTTIEVLRVEPDSFSEDGFARGGQALSSGSAGLYLTIGSQRQLVTAGHLGRC